MRYTRTWYHSRQHDNLCVFLILVVLMFSYILAQMHRHSPQPVEHSTPALRQEQRRGLHPILPLHCAFGATSIHIAWTPVYPLLLYSQEHVVADVDQTLIPHSIFAPEGTHGGYGTWQLMMSEEVFRLHKTCTGGYLLMKAQQSQFI